MSERSDEVKIVRRMLELGYQVELNVLRRLLTQEKSPDSVLTILESIARQKASSRERRFVITEEDAAPYFKSVTETEEASGRIPFDFKVVFDPTKTVAPSFDPIGYIRLFNSRYDRMLSLLRARPDFFQIEKVNTVKSFTRGKKVIKVAGFVVSKKVTEDYVILTLEDDSGYIRVMCMDDVGRKVEELLLDEFVMAEVESLPRGYFAKSVTHLDLPERTKKTSQVKVYAMFASDLRVGADDFDEESFMKLVGWINGAYGERDVVSRLKYLILNGDLVYDVLRKGGLSVEERYERLSGYLASVNSEVKVFVLPGEMDATRRALPQPAVLRKYARDLYSIRNVVMVGNPCMLQLHGVNVLLYHGQSLDDVYAQLHEIGVKRPTSAMKALLRARHVAPTYGRNTPIAPEEEDNLVIGELPDIMHCGHVGIPDEDLYRGTLLISTGAWNRRSAGVFSNAGRAALVDLSTFETTWKM